MVIKTGVNESEKLNGGYQYHCAQSFKNMLLNPLKQHLFKTLSQRRVQFLFELFSTNMLTHTIKILAGRSDNIVF